MRYSEDGTASVMQENCQGTANTFPDAGVYNKSGATDRKVTVGDLMTLGDNAHKTVENKYSYA